MGQQDRKGDFLGPMIRGKWKRKKGVVAENQYRMPS